MPGKYTKIIFARASQTFGSKPGTITATLVLTRMETEKKFFSVK